MKNANFYRILGVSRNATRKQIKQAFKEKAKLLHPDANPSPQAKEQFQMLHEAYTNLCPTTTRVHDESFSEQSRRETPPQPPRPPPQWEPPKRRRWEGPGHPNEHEDMSEETYSDLLKERIRVDEQMQFKARQTAEWHSQASKWKQQATQADYFDKEEAGLKKPKPPSSCCIL
eukprot:Platyproteum_vivax@DN653_c0_g1_i1.p1